jgi:hypothetical protein
LFESGFEPVLGLRSEPDEVRLREEYSELSRYPSPFLSDALKSRLNDSSAATSDLERRWSPLVSMVVKLPPMPAAAELFGNPPRLGEPCPGGVVDGLLVCPDDDDEFWPDEDDELCPGYEEDPCEGDWPDELLDCPGDVDDWPGELPDCPDEDDDCPDEEVWPDELPGCPG